MVSWFPERTSAITESEPSIKMLTAMKYARIVRPNKLIIEEKEIPKAAPGEVLIKVMASGICGTDIHILRGSYMAQYPVVPGHEFSGIIEELGEGVSRFEVGNRVAVEPNIACNNCFNCLNNRQNFCLNWQGVGVTRPGSMAQYVVAPENAVFDIGKISFEEGAFVEPLSCVLHGLGKVKISMGARVAIIGAGPIGVLMLAAVRRRGAVGITIVDKVKSRLDFAGERGADICRMDIEELERDTYDVVIDASGSIKVLRQTLDFARYGGTVLWFGVPPAGELLEIEPFIIFRKGLHVYSSYTSVRNSYQAIDLLKSGGISVRDLISHRLPLEELAHGIELIEKGEENVKKVLILPNF